jgi:hypothetical protein
MSRMIDLIRASAVPSNLMQSAAKGSLSVPPPEMIEILVHLAVHNKVFAEQAQLTLAGWDESASHGVACDPSTPKEVLDYMSSAKNLRPVLLPALLENPSVSEATLAELAPHVDREQVDIMLRSKRTLGFPAVMNALLSNPKLTGIQEESIRNSVNRAALEAEAAWTVEAAPAVETVQEVKPAPAVEPAPAKAVPETVERGKDEVFVAAVGEPQGADDVLEESVLAYLAQHAGEIAAAPDQPFQPIGDFYEELAPGTEEPLAETTTSGTPTAAAARKAPTKKTRLTHKEERGSALQKIAKLDIKGRIQLAMKGTKEERSLLIRDGTKIVALAVLESPKVGDGEVERFASQKNVLEAVLRGIPMKRRFAKNYAILRNLVFNPRTPLDVSLALMKNMLVGDLRNLSNNKEISDTVRKLATKLFKQKLESSGKR